MVVRTIFQDMIFIAFRQFQVRLLINVFINVENPIAQVISDEIDRAGVMPRMLLLESCIQLQEPRLRYLSTPLVHAAVSRFAIVGNGGRIVVI